MTEIKSESLIAKYLKKIDMSDVRLLALGVALLFIPVLFFLFFTGGNTRKISQEKMKTMVVRKHVFNFGAAQPGSSAAPRSGKDRGTGWFDSSSPAKKTESELEEALKMVKRSRRSERFPPSTTNEQKQAYQAEHHPMMTEGRGELERGNFAAAETMFLQAFDESGGNVFQQVYAMGALCELYELTHDQKKLEAAFKQYMELVGKLPAEYGGGDLAASVRNAYMALKSLQEGADPGKIAHELVNVEAVKQGAIQQGKVSQSLGKTLYGFPAKFD
ncbi:MAG: hypothetical protein PHV05_10790 [Candidatus Riflebacteria bacterium]|nr:hypothetical protein [Candidatus Riflebacteria bacterium]